MADEDDADAAGEDDEKSDASSVLGFGGDDSPAAPKRRANGKTRVSAENAKSPRKAAEKPAERPAGAKKAGVPATPTSTSTPLDATKKALASLQQVDALSIWKGSLREADISARWKKASEALSSLDKALIQMDEGSDLLSDARKIESETRDLVRFVPTMQEVLGKLRGAKKVSPLLHNMDYCQELTEVLQHKAMDTDTLAAILTLLPQKLLQEAVILVSL